MPRPLGQGHLRKLESRDSNPDFPVNSRARYRYNTLQYESTQRESNPHILHGKQGGYPYITGAWIAAGCQRSNRQ